MKYREIVNDFVNSEDPVDMVKLTEITEKFIDEVKDTNPDLVHRFMMKLKMYKHPFKNRERAEYAVGCLKNEDGSTGEHWDYDTTSKIAEKYGIESKPKFYYVLNMVYSDFYEPGKPDSEYVKEALKFIGDKDAPYDKVERYYRAMNY